jgi:hypothetical protein
MFWFELFLMKGSFVPLKLTNLIYISLKLRVCREFISIDDKMETLIFNHSCASEELKSFFTFRGYDSIIGVSVVI